MMSKQRACFSSVVRRSHSTRSNTDSMSKGVAFPEPPSSVYSIPSGAEPAGSAGAVIRDVGCSRRVFLNNPHLSTEEIEGLAYRIKALTKNVALSSVLIATTNDDDQANGALPSSLIEMDNLYPEDNEPPSDQMFYVSGGYDALELYKSKRFKEVAYMQRHMDAIGDLALATRGDPIDTRIPVITIPHGLVHDAGYAVCMGGYVLATPDTCFKVLNPSKGLSFDPIGLSFILPRLGWEFSQRCAEYSGCGHILALAGIEADYSDMMETGLATHFVECVSIVPTLERTLGQLPPWEQQKAKPKPKTFYGEPPLPDINAEFRNTSVAYTIECFCDYNVAGTDVFTHEDLVEDPSIELDAPVYLDRASDVVNYAATFDSIFREEKSLVGIMERLREIGDQQSSDPEELECSVWAKDLFGRMQRRSPLALQVMYSLMESGGKRGQTLESCIEREKRAQLKMFQMQDFERWASAEVESKQTNQAFTNWTYKSVADVPQGQVDEIVGE